MGEVLQTPGMIRRSISTLFPVALAALVAICLLALPVITFAATKSTPESIETALVRWNFQLDLYAAELKNKDLDGTVLNTIQNQTEVIRSATAAARKQAAEKLADVRQLLDTLGPPPATGQPAEEPSVSEKRFELNSRFAKFKGQQKNSELTYARANQILQTISGRLRAQRAQTLLEHGPSPLSWAVIDSAGPHLLYVLRQLVEAPLEEWAPLLSHGDLPRQPQRPLLALLLAFAIIWPIRRWLLRRFIRDHCVDEPSFSRKTITAVMIGIARGVLPALVTSVPLLLINMEQQKGIAADMVIAALMGITFALLTTGLARATLAPFSVTGWRMTRLTHNSSRRLYRRIVALSWAVAVFMFLEIPAAKHVQIPVNLSIFYSFIADTIIAAFVLSLLPARLWRDRAGRPVQQDRNDSGLPFTYGAVIRATVATIALAIPVASLLGYANLADYLTNNLFLTGLVTGVSLIMHGLARDITTLVLSRRTGHAPVLEGDQSQTEPETRILHFWLVASVDLALFIGAGLILLTAWGVAWKDLKNWLLALLNGIQIGNFTFSITDLASAIVIFIIVLVATRALQRLLEHRVFPQTRLDAGVRNSLKAATGYSGLVIALMLAISTIGLDLSNLAIIAGALSVGIGFGLQNVVNNFVSGLILLIERPIKVGDWIVIGTHEGYVRQINVRATEIQTFQRASVIIPNAELLSSALVNWTHKDTQARVEVQVGVAYGSDTAKVQDLLLDCAKSHPKVSRWPQPYVLFQDFGDSSLDFEVRFFIAQADQTRLIASDVRFAVDAAFRQHEVEIPFPQRDVHVRNFSTAEHHTNKDLDQESGKEGHR